MTSPLIAFLASALLAVPSFARIGETEAQIEKRYGAPQDTIKNSYGKRCRYRFGGFYVFVDFEHGISQMEVYQKKDWSVITPTETVSLLSANSGGAKWTNPELVDGDYIAHTTSRPRRVAVYHPGSRDLMSTSKDYIDRAADSINAIARKKMEGF
jgi:hypothetical protein